MRMFVAWSCLATASLAAPAAAAGTAAATSPAITCEARGTAAASVMLSRLTDAIATRHPDKVTRLFAPDATFAAFHAEGVRATYDQIRDAFVYFLVTNPDITFATMTPTSGCGVVAIEGQAIWRRSPKQADIDLETPVRISMILVETPEGWRIQQYLDERLSPDVLPDVTSRTAAVSPPRAPAVAGFVARSRAVKPVLAEKPADPDAYKAGRWIGDAPSFD